MFQVCQVRPGDFGAILSRVFARRFLSRMILVRFENDTARMVLKRDKTNIGFVSEHVHTSYE